MLAAAAARNPAHLCCSSRSHHRCPIPVPFRYRSPSSRSTITTSIVMAIGIRIEIEFLARTLSERAYVSCKRGCGAGWLSARSFVTVVVRALVVAVVVFAAAGGG